MIRNNRDLLAYIATLHRQGLTSISEKKVGVPHKLIEEGKKVFSVFIIKKGIAKCYLTEDNGKPFIQEFFGEGELFGELEAFKNHLSFCSIEALTPLEYYRIPHSDFQKLIEHDKKFNQFILESFASKILYKAKRHSYHQSHSIESNLLRLQEQLPSFTKIISKPDIASYLGITLRSLNRTLLSLKERNLLD
jgi:CRP-like cAMP-binding protein